MFKNLLKSPGIRLDGFFLKLTNENHLAGWLTVCDPREHIYIIGSTDTSKTFSNHKNLLKLSFEQLPYTHTH